MVQSMQNLSAPTPTPTPVGYVDSREVIQGQEEDSTLTFQRIWEEINPNETGKPLDLTTHINLQGDEPLDQNLERALLNYFEEQEPKNSTPLNIVSDKILGDNSTIIGTIQDTPPVSLSVDNSMLMEDIEQLYPGGMEEIFSHTIVSSHGEEDEATLSQMDLTHVDAFKVSKVAEASAEIIHTINKKLKGEPLNQAALTPDVTTIEAPSSVTLMPQMGFLPVMQWVQESKPPIEIAEIPMELKAFNGTAPTLAVGEAFDNSSFSPFLQGGALDELGATFEPPMEEFLTPELSFEMPNISKDISGNISNGDMKVSFNTVPIMDQPLQGNIQLTDSAFTQKLNTPVTPQSQQLFVEVRKAIDEGNDKITVKLTPASLGKVDIKIEVTPDGRSTVIIATERPETLDLFRKDASYLQNSLSEMGLDLDLGESSFNLMESFEEQSNAKTQGRQSKDEGVLEQTHQTYQYMSAHRGLYQEFA